MNPPVFRMISPLLSGNKETVTRHVVNHPTFNSTDAIFFICLGIFILLIVASYIIINKHDKN